MDQVEATAAKFALRMLARLGVPRSGEALTAILPYAQLAACAVMLADEPPVSGEPCTVPLDLERFGVRLVERCALHPVNPVHDCN